MTGLRELVVGRPGSRADEAGDPIPCSVHGCEVINYDDRRPYLCREHGLAVARRFEAALRSVHKVEFHQEEVGRAERRRRAREAEKEEVNAGQSSCVYYARIGDVIKIGFSCSLRERMKALRVSNLDLLAVEPGGREVERLRHAQFKADRVHQRKENFHPSARLLAHIESIGGREAVPAWAKIADPREIRRRVRL